MVDGLERRVSELHHLVTWCVLEETTAALPGSKSCD